MQRYKIGPVVIEMEYRGISFKSFISENPKVAPDIHIETKDEPYDMCSAVQLAQINDLTIWKTKEPDGSSGWAYKTDLGEPLQSTLHISSDYSNITYHSDFQENQTSRYYLLERLLQPLAACIAIKKGIVILHSACVHKNGCAIALSGKSGIGKSTRANLWIEHFGAEFLSGDRPWVDPIKGVAIGTPWDGKEQIFKNIEIPLKIIMEVRRASETKLCSVDNKNAFSFLVSQTFIPMWDVELTAKAFCNIHELMNNILFYQLYSDNTKEATLEAYKLLSKYIDFDL